VLARPERVLYSSFCTVTYDFMSRLNEINTEVAKIFYQYRDHFEVILSFSNDGFTAWL